ncbi:hypothetical protein HA402_006507 [Bradysia odoriphaga]|nr:hypothetical protein HA402_006507 [Bradysia odoriphaga]
MKRTMSGTTLSTPLKIVVFIGSVRNYRMADRVCSYVKAVIEKSGMEPVIIDPATLPFEILKTPLHFHRNPADAPQWLRDTNELIKEADGFVLLSPEYNYTLSPALTNMIDHFPPRSFRHKPTGIVTYSRGNYGGIASGLAALPFLLELGMVNIPTGVTIPTVHKAFSENGETNEEQIVRKVDQLVNELKWYAEALKDRKTLCSPSS